MTKRNSQAGAPLVADLTKAGLQSSPDCFARVFHFTRRDTRDYNTQTHTPNTKVLKSKLYDKNAKIGSGIIHNIGQDSATKARFTDIASDIISCIVNKTKGSPVGTFTVVVSPSDINYHHLLHPGDHIAIWMKRNKIAKMKKGSADIFNNKLDSGLKLYGVITSIRKIFQTREDGTRVLYYGISGKDFGYFFECDVYYNQIFEQILSSPVFAELLVFTNTLKGQVSIGMHPPDKLVSYILDAYLGDGPGVMQDLVAKLGNDPKAREIKDQTQDLKDFQNPTPNKALLLPQGVPSLFGVNSATKFRHLLRSRLGIEKYEGVNPEPNRKMAMMGAKQFRVDVGTKVPLWSILQSYGNLVINEMFADLKPHFYSSGKSVLLPTFVLRQIPFTSRFARSTFDSTTYGSQKGIPYTAFEELPRLLVSESFIMAENLGRGDQERFNFIELFGTTPGFETAFDVTAQVAFGNYAADYASIYRHGVRAMIPVTDYFLNIPTEYDVKKLTSLNAGDPDIRFNLIPIWINLLADWWLGAHLLESGTMELLGIEEPLSVGDNLQVIRENGVNELYHIEGYSHRYTISQRGTKQFFTTLTLTRGQRTDGYPIYASSTIGPDFIYNVGLTDFEPEGTGKPDSDNGQSAISSTEQPLAGRGKK